MEHAKQARRLIEAYHPLMHDDLGEPGTRLELPVFPLPNVVLFPHAVLPLHIFEERYKEMTAHALAGDRLIAMALLQPGWEKDYHAVPAIAQTICIGKILSHEKLPDGCYNFLLFGTARAQVKSETQQRPFRMVEAELVASSSTPEPELAPLRQRLAAVFNRGAFGMTPIARQFRKILADDISTADAADLIAFNFLDNIPLKQSLLAETDAAIRIDRLLSALESDPPPTALDVSPDDIILPLGDDPSLN